MVFGKIVRWLLRQITRKCPKCHNVFIDLIFDNFARDKLIQNMCAKCKFEQRLSKPLDFLFTKWVRVVDEPGGMRDIFSNSWFRKYLISLIRGIGKFGIGPPFVCSAPVGVTINLTRLCNLKCPHCYQEADNSKLPNELSTKEIISIIHQLADYGVIAMFYGGGEPLMHPDIYKIIKITNELGMFANLSTNGTLITEKVAKKLKNAGLYRVSISLDGINETHDRFRGREGTYERTINGIKNCKAVGIETAIAVTLTRNNYNEIPQIVELAKELKLDHVLLNNFIPIGRGKHHLELDVTPEERDKILRYFYKELVNFSNTGEGIECFTGASPFYARIAYQSRIKNGYKPIPVSLQTAGTLINRVNLHKYYQKRLWESFKSFAPYLGACVIGTSGIVIDPEGYIWPCSLIPLKIGNLRTEKFADIWEKNPLLNSVRKRKNFKGPCRDCTYYTCRGCRARPFAETGDILGPDTQCLYCLEMLKTKKEN